MASTRSDIRKLKRNASATAGELREFLAQMHGKSPREMLGAVASSNLGKALIQATVGVAAVIVVLTIVPFAWGAVFKKDAPERPAAVAVAPEAPEAPETPAGAPREPSLDPDAKPDRTLDALGIGGSKEAPLSVNPLEDAGDDILKDLE